MKTLLRALIVPMPWRPKRWLLQRLFRYHLHPSSRIGWSWVYPEALTMEAGASIGHLTVCKGLSLMRLGAHASIGRLNWISAYPSGRPPHFAHIAARAPELILGDHAAITHRHIIDCTERITIGRFATLAGYRSQLLTHSIDLVECRQDARAISIGDYCFVGTACTILGGTIVPDHSVVGANALLNQAYEESYRLYAGVPAKAVTILDDSMKYFRRTHGFVV
jgi:acetyltransferase-like isoleucine patch superfamily enzyme